MSAAVAVAPARHDDGAGDDAEHLRAPAGGFEKSLRRVGVPVGEDQLGVGRGVQDFTAEDAVPAVAWPRVAVAAEGAGQDLAGRALPR